MRLIIKPWMLGIAIFASCCVPHVHADEAVDYVKDVLPIFEKYCISCHSEDDTQGGLRMDSHDLLMSGGDSGAALTPGVSSSSRFLLMAAKKLEPFMPPDDAEGPTESELAVLAAWVDQGAKGPSGSVAMKRDLRTPDIKVSAQIRLPITAIATSPDGKLRAVARHHRVEVVDTTTGNQFFELPAQVGQVNSLSFSRSGKRLLVASGITGLRGEAIIYDAATGAMIQTIEGHDDTLQVAIFSPDETRVVTGSYDRQIILWTVADGKAIQKFAGHNGAISSLAISSDGRLLVSGSADATVKVWDVATGQRLDTMSQPQKEVLAVAISKDDSFVIAGSADNRLRVWQLLSRDVARINPLIATRFVDESPLTHIAMTPDGSRAVVVSKAGNVKVFSTKTWTQLAVLETVIDSASDLTLSVDGHRAVISLLNGNLAERELPEVVEQSSSRSPEQEAEPVYLSLDPLQVLQEDNLRNEQSIVANQDRAVMLPRGAEVGGKIGAAGEEDWYSFSARAGEMWVVETSTAGLKSSLDSRLEIRDVNRQPILQTRLQATRDSYFTFRGKNSSQADDFRVFAWEEMKLDEYFYAAGEVTRLWMAPRGADSGFWVYPGASRGNRWTYFGTSGTTHALGEPAYIVRPLAYGEPPAQNGLPVFDLDYSNDDHPTQNGNRDSFVLFKAPADHTYHIRLVDTRGEGSDGHAYRLKLRPAAPMFSATTEQIKGPLRKGAGREFTVSIDRLDGFMGEVWFEIDDLPPGVHSNFPLRVQPEQNFAVGTIWCDEDLPGWKGEIKPELIARATINGMAVERRVGTVGKLKLAERPQAILRIHPDESATQPLADKKVSETPSPWVVPIRRGETISLIVKADRADGFKSEISLGKEVAGRNMPHGVYVDNIGLNGLLIRENESERQFFITADPVAELGRREFFLTGAIDGGVSTPAVILDVLP